MSRPRAPGGPPADAPEVPGVHRAHGPGAWTRGVRLGLAALALLAASCGWHAGLAVPDVLAPNRTVGVEVFGTNRERVLARDLEPLLHEELSRAVSDLVSAPLVSPDRADVVVRGRIVDLRRRSGIRRANTGTSGERRNDLLETSLRMVVSAELVDASGRVLRPARNAAVSSGYAVGLDGEEAARARALRHVSETLVLDLFGLVLPPSEPRP